MARLADPNGLYGAQPSISKDGRWVAAVMQKNISSPQKYGHDLVIWKLEADLGSAVTPEQLPCRRQAASVDVRRDSPELYRRVSLVEPDHAGAERPRSRQNGRVTRNGPSQRRENKLTSSRVMVILFPRFDDPVETGRGQRRRCCGSSCPFHPG